MTQTTTAPTQSPLATLKAAETGLCRNVHQVANHIRDHVATGDLSDALDRLRREANEAKQRLIDARRQAADIVASVLSAIRSDAHRLLDDLACWEIDREELIVLPMPEVVARAACAQLPPEAVRSIRAAEIDAAVTQGKDTETIDLAALPDDAREAVRERAAAETVTPPAPTPEAKAGLDAENNGGASVPMEAPTPAPAPDLPTPDVASAPAPISAPVPPAPAKPKGRKKGGR